VPEIANEVREGQIHSVLLNENYKGKNFRFISKVGVEFMAYQAMKAFMSYESKYAENIQDMQILTNTLRIANQINDYIQNERSKKGKLDNYRYMYDPNLIDTSMLMTVLLSDETSTSLMKMMKRKSYLMGLKDILNQLNLMLTL